MDLVRVFDDPRVPKKKEKSIKMSVKMLRNWSAVSKAIFKGFWSIFEAILGPKMEPTSKKNGIKNKSDSKTKL